MPSAQRAKLCFGFDAELPPEILHHCFKYLAASGLARVEACCQRLRAVVRCEQ